MSYIIEWFEQIETNIHLLVKKKETKDNMTDKEEFWFMDYYLGKVDKLFVF